MKSVFQVAKVGFDVVKDREKIKHGIERKGKLKKSNYHLLQALGLAYFYGAKSQVFRYREASLELDTSGAKAILVCLHEFSCLLEDLVTVGRYLEKCNRKHKLNTLIVTMRNHIRHDIREEFDNETYLKKIKSLKKLNIPNHLQTDITFDKEYIRIGDKTLSLEEIDNYLYWAEKNIIKIFDEAYDKGYIKERFWSNNGF